MHMCNFLCSCDPVSLHVTVQIEELQRPRKKPERGRRGGGGGGGEEPGADFLLKTQVHTHAYLEIKDVLIDSNCCKNIQRPPRNVSATIRKFTVLAADHWKWRSAVITLQCHIALPQPLEQYLFPIVLPLFGTLFPTNYKKQVLLIVLKGST